MFKYHLFALCWALFIFATALLPGSSLPDFLFFGILPLDKLVHFVEYAILTFLLITGFFKQFGGKSYRFNAYRISSILVIFYSVILEFFQLLVPGRNFEVMDLVANFSGILFGRFLFYLIYTFNIR